MFEKTVSPPLKNILYRFCSSLRDLLIFDKLNLENVLDFKNLSKINYISNGDDYQVLFTASKSKKRIIEKISSNYRIKLTKIGSILSVGQKSSIVDDKNTKINLKIKGYFHQF